MTRELGLRGTFRYLFLGKLLTLKQKFSGRESEMTTYLLTTKTCPSPLTCRLGTSDRIVFAQVFIDLQYATTTCLENPELIIDGGANVGYSSAYFLSRYPNAKVIAVEPEIGNYRQACKNLRAFGSRATVLQAGIWSKKSGLKIVRRPYRDGEEWAFQVKECEEGEEMDVQGIDIASILENFQFDRIDILKMDIEGSEKQVFSHNVDDWIKKVGQFQIELHDDECHDIFCRSLLGGEYNFEVTGEVTVATRL